MKTLLTKKISLFIAFAIIFFTAFALTGCTTEIALELKKDGSVEASFSGSAGKAFAAMINSAAGVSSDSKSESVIFDLKEIEYELGKNGFSNVKGASQNGTDLILSMIDKNKKSALFTSGIVSTEKGLLEVNLTPQSLVEFYNASDSQTTMFLDMLLAPIFNDEQMTEEEYLEVLASFYGEEIADEIAAADFRITLKNPDGNKTTKKIKLTKLLTLNEIIRF